MDLFVVRYLWYLIKIKWWVLKKHYQRDVIAIEWEHNEEEPAIKALALIILHKRHIVPANYNRNDKWHAGFVEGQRVAIQYMQDQLYYQFKDEFNRVMEVVRSAEKAYELKEIRNEAAKIEEELLRKQRELIRKEFS